MRNEFEELGLSKPVLAALKECGYTEPTEIQSRVIRQILEGKDIVASAETGSGKTAAFALPVIECLEEPQARPRALVLAPTRELAQQVETQFKKLGKNMGLRTVTLYGGTAYDKQIRALKNSVDVIVATPGRLLDCVEKRFADLSGIEILILDEADRLLDLGFAPQIRRILARLPKERQTLMFSATIDQRVARMANEYMIDPDIIRLNTKKVEAASIDQKFIQVNEFGKDALLLKLIEEHEMKSVIVFTKTKRKATWVRGRLRDARVAAEEIHGDISQSQRERTLSRYRKGEFAVLVATDVAARGLDIPLVSHVVNYDLPENPADYVHRIGRTGRAGRAGMSVTFVSEGQEFMLQDIERLLGKAGASPQASSRKSPVRRFKPPRRRVI